MSQRSIDSISVAGFYELGEHVGAVGGGGIDFRMDLPPIMFALQGLDPKGPRWGSEYKNLLRRWFTHSLYGFAHTTSLPVPTNGVSLDPHVRDAWGLPAIRMTFTRHENDRKIMEFFGARVTELLDAAGGHSTWMIPVAAESYPEFHLLGTCRMGNDPGTSVVDKYHRAHDVPNLFIVDGSSFVTSGRGQPTMTIQALAFRAGEHIAATAKRGEI